MSFDKTPKSDRYQIITAIVLMGLFATVFLVVAIPKDSFTSFMCSYVRNFAGFAGMCLEPATSTTSVIAEQFVASRITAACVDTDGLKLSVAFEQPLTGNIHLQVYSTGPDFFPSERGMTDTYESTMQIAHSVDHMDYVIPAESMPVGEELFGNIVVSEDEVLSHVAYFMNVADCAATAAFPSQFVANGSPIINSAICLPTRHLMIAFEFEESVPGQYQASVAGTPYRLASVISQPATLFFSGAAPPQGPIVIKLVSALDQAVVFEEPYTPPICGST